MSDPPNKHLHRMQVRVPRDIHLALVSEAAEIGEHLAVLVRRVLREHVERRQKRLGREGGER